MKLILVASALIAACSGPQGASSLPESNSRGGDHRHSPPPPPPPTEIELTVVTDHQPDQPAVIYPGDACVVVWAQCLVGDGRNDAPSLAVESVSNARCTALNSTQNVWYLMRGRARFRWPCRGAGQVWVSAHVANDLGCFDRNRQIASTVVRGGVVHVESLLQCQAPEARTDGPEARTVSAGVPR